MDNDKILLFKITTESCDPFEGKTLDMLKHLLNNCDSVEFCADMDGNIEISFF